MARPPSEGSRSAPDARVPIAPSLTPLGEPERGPQALVDGRVLGLALAAVGIGVVASLVALALVALIAGVTNLAFFGRLSVEGVSPAENRLGWLVVVVPVVGGLVVGLMARYGSKAIRGHGIPEAMEQVLVNRSRIPARVTLLKPLSAAISIGTGGPFGAEGPIIATGGALGSLLGQLTHVTATERKTLLATGAAAGMAATFGSPASAVLLAIELLLFELRPRSFLPVAIGAATAAGMRILLEGSEPVFAMAGGVAPASLGALAFYLLLGAAMGACAAAISWLLYALEDGFERLPLHWMWWPALGALVVGVVGAFAPRTLGVGYENITAILSAEWTTGAILFLCLMKLVSWSVSLGSGTSGGTLAPMFTIGGGLGHALGALCAGALPWAGIDVRVAALVGMAALFAGASRACLTSAVFAFETTHEPHGLLPLLAGCAASYLVAALLMKNSIMTERIARRGIRSPAELVADPLEQVLVTDVATPRAITLEAERPVADVRAWIAAGGPGTRHQGFPILDARGVLVGVLTRRDLLDPAVPGDTPLVRLITRRLCFVHDDSTARQAADHMLNHDVGRLPVVSRADPRAPIGIVTRSDVLSGYRRRLQEHTAEPPTLRVTGRRAPRIR